MKFFARGKPKQEARQLDTVWLQATMEQRKEWYMFMRNEHVLTQLKVLHASMLVIITICVTAVLSGLTSFVLFLGGVISVKDVFWPVTMVAVAMSLVLFVAVRRFWVVVPRLESASTLYQLMTAKVELPLAVERDLDAKPERTLKVSGSLWYVVKRLAEETERLNTHLRQESLVFTGAVLLVFASFLATTLALSKIL